jgi:hypothetical protein
MWPLALLLAAPQRPQWGDLHICCLTIFRQMKQKLLNLEWFLSLKINQVLIFLKFGGEVFVKFWPQKLKRIICNKFPAKKLSNFLGDKKLLLVHCAMALKLLIDVHCDTLSLVLISKTIFTWSVKFWCPRRRFCLQLPTQEFFFKQIS